MDVDPFRFNNTTTMFEPFADTFFDSAFDTGLDTALDPFGLLESPLMPFRRGSGGFGGVGTRNPGFDQGFGSGPTRGAVRRALGQGPHCAGLDSDVRAPIWRRVREIPQDVDFLPDVVRNARLITKNPLIHHYRYLGRHQPRSQIYC